MKTGFNLDELFHIQSLIKRNSTRKQAFENVSDVKWIQPRRNTH